MSASLDYYKVFLAAAQEEHFTRAAKRLYTSQSAVSQTVSALEEQLGLPLFKRVGRGLKLTPEGRHLAEGVAEAMAILDRTEKELFAMRDLEAGRLMIGASDTISRYFVLPLLTSFSAAHPNIQLTFINRSSPRITEMVTEGSLDIGFVNIDPEKSYDAVSLDPVATFDHGFIRRRGSFPEVDHLSDLAHVPMITLEDNATTRRVMDRFLEKEGIRVTPTFAFGSMELILEMVRRGMGMGFVTTRAVSPEDELEILTFGREIPHISVGLITRKDAILSKAQQTFVKKVKEEVSR